MKSQTRSSRKATEAEFNEAARKVIEIGRQLPLRIPSPADKKFHLTMKKAMRLDKDLEPVKRAIYRRILDTLPSETDRELFRFYSMLQVGSVLSQYAPRHLVATDLTFGDYIKLYTTWAKKAEKLLKAAEPGEQAVSVAPRRKNATRARLESKGR